MNLQVSAEFLEAASRSRLSPQVNSAKPDDVR